MKKFIINKCINYIKKNTNYDDIKLKEIEYGIVSIYLTISKLIVISLLCYILGIFKEMIIFTLFFNIIRLPAFGIHAKKSWMCWVSSIIGFICIPYLCTLLFFNNYIKILICIICIILIIKNAPADTHKRPIVNKKRRKTYKIISSIIAIIFSISAIIIKNNFLSNCLIFALILENILIAKTTYKIFKLPYNNYVNYLKLHPELQN